MNRPAKLLGLGLVVAALGAGGVWWVLMRPRIPPAERGRRIAEATGCFACHGAEGSGGVPNPGRVEKTVPSYGGELMMYARSDDQIREWIRDGVPAARAKSKSWQADRDAGAVAMPAFGKILDEGEIDALVAFVKAVNGSPAPDDEAAARGRRRAEAIGCFGCHGPGGRFARPNPGSFKGYIPSWDGADFAELVQSRAEFDQWVLRGRSERFRKNPLARFFLDRAPVQMPAYESKLDAGDLDALWAYVTWLRTFPSGRRSNRFEAMGAGPGIDRAVPDPPGPPP